MARKKKHPEHVNHERWLVSYADFITLLFAFFVVMFAVSQVDSKKMGRFTESFSKAVGIDLFSEMGSSLVAAGEKPTSMEGSEESSSSLPAEIEQIRAKLAQLEEDHEIPQGVQVLTHRRELILRLSENLLFDVGDDSLHDPARKAINIIAQELARRDVDVRIEGHTDTRPIHTTRFRSNWDLSTARSTAVVAEFLSGGMPPVRISAAGYAEFHPVASNDTDEGRRQNRRVDIVVGTAHHEAATDE